MAHAASGIGLQNPAFFEGRAELLDWVNGLLNLKLTKVEQVRRSDRRDWDKRFPPGQKISDSASS